MSWPSRAQRRGVAPSGSGAIRVLCREVKSLPGPDGVPRDGPGRGPQGHCRRELDEMPCRGVSGSGRGAAVTVTESVRAKSGPSRALRCDVAPSGARAIRVLCRDVKGLVRTECRGAGRAMDHRVADAVSSMGSHVTVYLAVVKEPQSRSPRLCV